MLNPAEQIAAWADRLRDISAMGLLFSKNIHDEGIQSILPNRVYDIRDVGFDTSAVVLVIGERWVLEHLRHRVQARRLVG